MAGERRAEYVALVREAIEPASILAGVRTDASGAVALFTGVVRDHHRGKRVESLTYEAYGAMAEREMGRIASEIRSRWCLEGIAIVHRLGRLAVGEISIAVATAAAHRREAIEACAHAIDAVKERVPIWKKEHGEAGEGWVIGDDSPGSASGPFTGGSGRGREPR